MTLLSLILGFVLSTIFGAAFHFWRGGNLGQLILYLFLSWSGFWLGHLTASWTGLTIGMIGTLNISMGCIGSIITLLVGNWLFRVEKPAK